MNILFDLDGTLMDPFEGITKSILHALWALGRVQPVQQDLRWCIGPPLRICLAKLLASDDIKLIENAVALFRERFASVGLFENEVYAGIPEALDALNRNGHVLYVATSKPMVYAERITQHFDLRQHFRSIFGSELDGAKSDKRILVSHVLNSASIAAQDSLMVGDREHDMIAAKSNGITGVGVLWGYGTKKELEASGASVCLSSPGELPDLPSSSFKEQRRLS